MQLPNYKNGSIVNLMSSITAARGYKSRYGKLKLINQLKLSKSKNIVLIVIDGLGYDFFKKHSKSKLLRSCLKGKITSVFPSTTAAAISTFRTGLPPSEHGLVGWFQYFKTVGEICVPLRFCVRGKENVKVKYNFLSGIKSVFQLIKTKSCLVLPKIISNTKFTKELIGKAKIMSYTTPVGFYDGSLHKKEIKLY